MPAARLVGAVGGMRRFTGMMLRWALLLLLGSIGALCLAFRADAAVLSFGITSATALSAAHYIAQDEHFYEAEGVTVDTTVAGAAVGVIQQLAGGSLNLGQAATDQSLRAIMHGAPLKIIAGAASNAPFRVVAAKGITRWDQLKGKIVSVGGVKDVTLYFLRVMARKNGLADQDYDLVYAGGTPERFAQLLSGAVAAAVLTNPLDFTAIARGFGDLGSVPQYLPHWAQNNILVDERWAAKNHAAIVAFLRARIKASDYFYDPRNRDEVIQILARHTGTTKETAAATYDLYVKEQVVAPKSALFPAGIAANLDAFVAMGEIAAPPPVGGFIDARYLEEATR